MIRDARADWVTQAPVANPPESDSNSREKLLLAARKLFARHGFDGTTVRALALEAGTNICMVSYHFGGKDELYRACIERYGRARLDATTNLLEPCQDAAEFRVKLSLFIRTLLESIATEPEVHRILNSEVERGLPNARPVFEDTLLVAINRLIEFIKAAQSRGIVRPGLDGFYLAAIIYSTIGFMGRTLEVSERYFRHSIADKHQREKMTEQLTELLTGGCLV
jgi:AcrR family transcriptional regulator